MTLTEEQDRYDGLYKQYSENRYTASVEEIQAIIKQLTEMR
jgi:hypothetical protein